MKMKVQALIIHRRQMRLRRNFPTERKARKFWIIRSSSPDATRMKTMQWRAALPLLCFFAMAATVHGQPGFISIDCGRRQSSNYTSPSGIVYVPDAGYVDGGVNVDVPIIENLKNFADRYMTMRSFPNGTRNCYTVGPVKEGQRYLVRAGFLYGNYDGKNSPPEFDLYLGVNLWQTVKTLSDNTVLPEIIVISPANALQICLVKTGPETPFISVLEVRPVQNSVYKMVNRSQSLVLRELRDDYGGNQSTRYPADPYDRIWFASANQTGWTTVSTDKDVDRNDIEVSTVPQAVLKTAIVSEGLSFRVTVPSDEKIILFMYFAELEQLGSNETREFNVLQDGKLSYGPYRLNYSIGRTLYTAFPGVETTSLYTLNSTSNSTRPPMINAREAYGLKQLESSPTDSGDGNTISEVKDTYEVKKNWQGDPCLPRGLAWEGVGCRYDSLVTPRIVSLNLSGSGLAGGISPSIANLTALTFLDLSNNNLTGEIPDELTKLQNLAVLNLASNQLNGSLPRVFYDKMRNKTLLLSIDGNAELCKKVDFCQASNKEDKKNIVPIVAGVSASVIFVVGLIVVLVWRVKLRKEGTVQSVVKETENPRDLRGQLNNQQGHFNRQSHEFSFADIVVITQNFRRLIGRGGFATVYYGSFDDGTEVAVKMLSKSSQGRKDFHAEGQILTRVHHKNLVRLLGYCDENDNLALVYEYMSKGSLAEHLTSGEEDSILLNWDMRLRIAVDVAQGLDYMHSFCKPPIVHRDIKPRNILLNGHLEAKLGDFGLSRLFSREDVTHISTMVAGTPGYLDPEYHQSFKLNEKSDVFSFGIALLEIITGQPPISSDPGRGALLPWVVSRLERGDIDGIIDKRLMGDYDQNSTWKALEIALACASAKSIHRPTMSQVVAQLKECLESAASREPPERASPQVSKPYVSLITPSAR